MNKLIITIVSALLVITSSLAFTQDAYAKPDRKGPANHRGAQAMPMLDNVQRAIRKLDLSAEQKENVWTIVHNLKGQLHPVTVDIRDGQRQLRELVKSGDFDKGAVSALAKKEGELVAQRILLTSEAVANIYGQLSAEQKAQLDTMAAERKQRVKGKRDGKRKPKARNG